MCKAVRRASFIAEGWTNCSHLPRSERCEDCRAEPVVTLTMDEVNEVSRSVDWFTDHLCITPGEPQPILSAKAKLEQAAALV